jgi:hypothetical protein
MFPEELHFAQNEGLLALRGFVERVSAQRAYAAAVVP